MNGAYAAQGNVIQLRQVSIHQTASGQSAEVAATIEGRPVANRIGFRRIRPRALWHLDRRVLVRLANVLPMVVPIFSSIAGGFDEGLEKNRRSANHIAQH